MQETTRLHISPLTPELLSKILPQGVRELARNITFQQLETFPERNYGFLELPTMEAQKLKKKANGSIIKGVKVKVEEAREKRRTRRTSNDDAMEVDGSEHDGTNEDDQTTNASVKKRKREDGVLQGHELSEERKVKRGWTEPTAAKIKEKRDKKRDKDNDGEKSKKKSSKKQQASQYSDEAECLFKTKVPPNKQDLVPEKGKGKKSKKAKDVTEAVVHEYEHNQKHPSFVKNTANKDAKPVADYDDDKGWVDTDGKVVELPRRTRSRGKAVKKASASPEPQTSTTTVERLGSLSLKEQEDPENRDDETSSSGASSSSSAASEADDDAGGSSSEASIPPKAPVSVKEKSATPQPSIAAAAPHPLEVLYKKPGTPASRNKANLSVEAVPFSFFGPDAGADADDELSSSIRQGIKTAIGPGPAIGGDVSDGAAGDVSSNTLASPPSARPRRGAAAKLPNLAIPPATPFTQRDMMWRAQRSAAPTPDTAMPNKTGFGNVWGSVKGRKGMRLGDEEEIEEEDEDEEMSGSEIKQAKVTQSQLSDADELESGAQGDESSEGEPPGNDEEDEESAAPKTRKTRARGEESEFVKEKFAHRGEINRTWKREMREENKAKRKAKNRRSNA